MLGKYENFPLNIHFIESFSSQLNSKQLQQRLLEALKSMNRKPFSFEQVAIPTVPGGEVIFEFGLAEDDGFNFLDNSETQRMLEVLKAEKVQSLDFFCAIRYYRVNGEKRTPLKFDYYMLRTGFAAKTFEMQIFHKQGPRYLSPEDLSCLIVEEVNRASAKKVLKRIEASD